MGFGFTAVLLKPTSCMKQPEPSSGILNMYSPVVFCNGRIKLFSVTYTRHEILEKINVYFPLTVICLSDRINKKSFNICA
jgi:hypothetical protein